MYGQVTKLFETAPDLLEDFKQFLPESAAQAKAAAKAAAEEASLAPGPSQTPQPSTGRPGEAKMPAMGNFIPPSSNTKDNKKRKGNTAAGAVSQNVGESSARGASGNKVCITQLLRKKDDSSANERCNLAAQDQQQ